MLFGNNCLVLLRYVDFGSIVLRPIVSAQALYLYMLIVLCNRLLPPSELARKELKPYYNWASIAPTAQPLHTNKSLS